ncbi:hypothetical protein DMA12_02970 [Amycolatopsis balhimycina DSM 5908]|uniref:ESX-1 secretion-associated protein n=1 Tax=Amycolatopsis balhimycina DSM 5908 TaxID=1081091 RepID=A0A428X4G9_AMYBA|nr:hypothetical protein [Amycolatopsis balhimycina]RSM50226.1 hypothetical protein DMA12_02970 [Amycolatopsis balhimycina DSM 5908]
MPDGGYQASSDAMLTAQTALERAAEKTTSQAGKVAPTPLAQQSFGRVHGQYFTDYKTGIDSIGAAMKGYAGQLTQLGGGVGTAATKYTTADEQQAAAAKKAGSN